MPRISRKERQRREKISRGLRRYWREVRAVAQTEGLSLPQARGVLSGELITLFPGMAIPVPVTVQEVARVLEIFALPVRAEWVPEPEQGEFAFNLRDVNESEGIGLPEQFRGQRVTADFRLQVFTEGRQAPPEERFISIEFDAGDSEQEFWSNYYEALREGYEGEVEDEGISSSDVGIAAISMRGS